MEATYITPGVSLSAANAFTGAQTITRTTSPGAGQINQVLLVDANYAAVAGETAFSTYSKFTNSGSTTPNVGDHLVACLGRALDTSGGKFTMYGSESRVDAAGTASVYGASFHFGLFGGAAFSGQLIGAYIRSEIYTNGSYVTPLAQGAAIGVKVEKLVGGTLQRSWVGYDEMQNQAAIGAYDTGGAYSLKISHDGTDSRITSSTGQLRIYTGGGNYVVIQDGAGLVPGSEGALLGIDSFRWGLVKATSFNIGPTATPGTSVTRIKHGVTSAMTAGAITVTESTTTANSRIFLSHQTSGGTPGWLRVSSRSAGTSFTITSSSGTDTSTVNWIMIEP